MVFAVACIATIPKPRAPVGTIERLAIPFHLGSPYSSSARPRLFSLPHSSSWPHGTPPKLESPHHYQRTHLRLPPPIHPGEQLFRWGQKVASFVARLPGGPRCLAHWPTPAIFLIATRPHFVCAVRIQIFRGKPRPFASRIPHCGEATRTRLR